MQALVTGTLISPATLPAATGAPVTVRVANGVAVVTLADAVAETFQVAITNNAGLTNPAQRLDHGNCSAGHSGRDHAAWSRLYGRRHDQSRGGGADG